MSVIEVDEITVAELEVLGKLDKDLRKAADTLSRNEARFLVDLYYQIQENRKIASNQVNSQKTEPHVLIGFVVKIMKRTENSIKYSLDRYTSSMRIGEWAKSIVGIGPVITAGLLAHIEMEKAPTVGHIWAFAGLDPSKSWNKGQKRPWNANLKTLCWKIGQSFMKCSNKPTCFYGQVYRERKELEKVKNSRGDFADQAKAKLEKFNIGKTTDAYAYYSVGQLPPAHIDARARRYAVKLFLCHFWQVWFYLTYMRTGPKPWILTQEGHCHELLPPNIELIDGMKEAYHKEGRGLG